MIDDWQPRFPVLHFLLPFWVLCHVSEHQTSSILKIPRSFHLGTWSYVRCRILTTFLLPLLSLEGIRRHLVVNTPCKHKFLFSRVSNYPNSVTCFHQLQLVLSGDVQLNPGPISLNSSCTTSNSKLNYTPLNSRSLCNKLVEFQGLVYGDNLDVIAVTETWPHDGYFDGEILSSSQYTIFWKDRGGKRRGGSVLLAVKTNLLAYRRPDLEPQNSEILVCDLLSPNSFKIAFCLC